MGAGAVVTATTLQALTACLASALQRSSNPGLRGRRSSQAVHGSYGELAPTPDQNGDEILALPGDFSYVTFSKIGDPMADGNLTPRNLDGMGTFAGPNGTVRLIRNHEVRNDPGDRAGAVIGPSGTRYDELGMAGTVTVDYDPVRKRVMRNFVSLNGTVANCSGGHAYRDVGWITCEETTVGPQQGWYRKHGYAFFVPASADAPVTAEPIVGMGRFFHEAAVADPATGIVYQTEDDRLNLGNGFYRYLPLDPADLLAGGELEMLRIKHAPRADLRDGQTIGKPLPIEWVTIENPDPDLEAGEPSVFEQGYARGGAMFARLEGIFRGEEGSIYFVSTTGGDAKNGNVTADGFAEGRGQLWRYRSGVDRDELVLIFESPGESLLDSPDNLVITPNGGILLCEDDTTLNDDAHPLAPRLSNINHLIGLTRDATPFQFAINRLNGTEFAGICFSPDGDTLFANIYGDGSKGSGMTCAITGPWHRGPL
jgi:secreted PhoX family phosphatase